MADSAATKFKLQWNDHGNELSRLSRDVFGRDDLTDVTLTCRGGTPFHAHKMILAAASTYFRNFFMEVQGKINQHQVIFMKDIEPAEMEHLLQFIYLGEVDVPGQELERLIAISKELAIIGMDAIKQEEDAPLQRRIPKLAKRKSTTTTIENAEPLPTKQARVKSDPIYDDELVDQDIFDGYMDNGEDDRVTEGDVQDKLGNEEEASNDQPSPATMPKMPPMTSSRGTGKKLSPIWDHFSVSPLDPKYAQCIHCNKQISRGSSIPRKQGLSSMKNHLKTQHREAVALSENPQSTTHFQMST